jgi:acetyl-CoA carboxylase biotin carboxyl carrier protein
VITAKDVAEIARLLDESSFDELHLELDGLKLSLRRTSAARPESAPDPAAANATASAPAPAPAIVVDPNTHAVAAPLLGTFYRAPKPGAQPFVDVGSPVEEDSIIGIIEVMKLMNTVRAGVRGTVIEILAQDGALVEYGQVLLRVAKAT